MAITTPIIYLTLKNILTVRDENMFNNYKSLSDDEKGLFWDIMINASADIPDIFKDIPDFGGKVNTLFGTGVAAIRFIRTRLDFKKYYSNFESITSGLIPEEISQLDTKKIFRIITKYLKRLRRKDKNLSFYYFNKNKSAELVEDMYNFCISSYSKWNATNDCIHKAIENIIFVLLQNNNNDVMLLTETVNVIRDILDRLEQDRKHIKSLESKYNYLQTEMHSLKSNYSSLINNVDLPDSTRCDNIFSFRNRSISFRGRNTEILRIQEWLKDLGVSVIGVIGPAGSGKSRLALHIAHLEEENRKVVWADKTLLTELSTCNDFSYSQSVLFIVDYAAQLENELDRLIKIMVSRKNPDVKFLLLERSESWYKDFIRRNDIIKQISIEQPIDLQAAKLSDEDYEKIMKDFSDARYDGKNIPKGIQKQIIRKTIQLSNGKTTRFLFLLLLIDAYLRNGSIDYLSSDILLHNYINHSFGILAEEYGKEVTLVGFRVLAYATVCDGIEWEDDYPAIQNDLDIIINKLTEDRELINCFFQKLSESSENYVVSPLKPDLIGEYLFLHEWTKLIKTSRCKWISTLLKQECSRFFLASRKVV